MPEQQEGRVVRHRDEYACCSHCGLFCDDLHLSGCGGLYDGDACAAGNRVIQATDADAYDARHARNNREREPDV